MASTYPSSLDNFTNPLNTDKLNNPPHATQHADNNDAIEALEAKVGANNSAVTTSHDYKLGEITSTDKAVGKTATQTLTNKTITSPLGLVKNDVGLGNVDNTSDATKNAAAVTLTNKTFDNTSPTAFFYPGFIQPYAMRTPPTGWLSCDGSNVSRTTYASLFATLAANLGAFTVTIAAPAVVTLTAHGLSTGDQIYLTTAGALPTGLTANTLYYVIRTGANTFNLATSRANAYASTTITTTGSQSGIHTLWDCPYGLGDGSTTFTLPDFRGRILAGLDTTSGTAASRLTLAQTQGVYGNIGASGGAQSHQLTTAELASHNHGATAPYTTAAGLTTSGSGIPPHNSVPSGGNWSISTATSGSDTAHNNIQPVMLANYIIKT